MKTSAIRSLLSATAFALVVMFLFGCKEKSGRSDGRIEITFWHSFVASTVPALNDLVARFEQEHPGIAIKAQYVPTGDALIQKLVTSVQSHTSPDISWIHADFIDKLVDGNAIYRMDEFLSGPDSLPRADVEDIFPPLLQAATWKGTLYAMPMEATSLALIYNRDLFRTVGLDPDHPPATWDELLTYARKLTIDADGNGLPEQYGFYVPVFPSSGDLNIWMILQWTPFLWQAGGAEINAAQTHVLFNSPAGVAALTLWRTLYDDVNSSTFGIAHDIGFASQRVAMVMDGPWNLPRYRQIKTFSWAVAPLPAGPVRRATYVAGEHLAIFRQTTHPREAWTFVKWMLKPEVQAMFSEKSGYLPVRKSTLSLPSYKAYLATDPALKAFVDQMAVGQGRMPIDYHRIEINRFLAEAIEKATLGKQDPRAMLDEAAAKSDAVLGSSR
jgi:ABC-type glycerol-3-phosphate transport system substrate-binding protein